MFLAVDAINIIVMDISKSTTSSLTDGDEQLPLGVPNTQEEFLCYWLRSIHEKAQKEKMEPNVILVLTHTDLIPSTERGCFIPVFEQEIQSTIQRNQLLPITSERVYLVNNKDPKEDSFRKLRCQLVQLMREQETWEFQRLITWLKLEAEMKGMLLDKHAKYIGLKEIRKIADKYGLTQDAVESCLMFLNEMGDIVWFKDEVLKDVIILEPQWLVDTFKVLITSEQFIKKRHLQDEVIQLLKHGTITMSTLHKFWAGNDVEFLTELMQKFNHMVQIRCAGQREQKFLIPCMLPPQRFSDRKTWDNTTGESAFSVKYRSSFHQWIPIGTFPKLLAACAKKWSLLEEKYLSSRHASLKVEEGTTLTLSQSHGSSLLINICCQSELLQRHPLAVILEATALLSSFLKLHRLQPSELCQLICPQLEAWR